MKTKIVYVVISTEKDIYLEQAWLSTYSLKLHNPQAYVTLLVDDCTKKSLCGNREKEIEFCDEVIEVEVPKEMSPKERSRYIKTKVRDLISGDYLFIDTDTIITDNLDEIDNYEGDILAVPDLHTDFSHFLWRDNISKRMRKMYGLDVSTAPYYFNSGVMLVRDTQLSHSVYDKWHQNWKDTLSHNNCVFDQHPLFKTDFEMGHVIKPLSGIYNCQLLGSVQYLWNAKIIHFYNAQWANDSTYCPFFGKDIYLKIKNEGVIGDDIKKMVSNVKSQLASPSVILGREDFLFFSSRMIKWLNKMRTTHHFLYAFFEFEFKILNKVIK